MQEHSYTGPLSEQLTRIAPFRHPRTRRDGGHDYSSFMGRIREVKRHVEITRLERVGWAIGVMRFFWFCLFVFFFKRTEK